MLYQANTFYRGTVEISTNHGPYCAAALVESSITGLVRCPCAKPKHYFYKLPYTNADLPLLWQTGPSLITRCSIYDFTMTTFRISLLGRERSLEISGIRCVTCALIVGVCLNAENLLYRMSRCRRFAQSLHVKSARCGLPCPVASLLALLLRKVFPALSWLAGCT